MIVDDWVNVRNPQEAWWVALNNIDPEQIVKRRRENFQWLLDGLKGPLIVLHREGKNTHLVVTFDTLPAKDRAEASSVFHLLRNIGSSFFISLSIAEIVRTAGANYSRMSEMITPFNPALMMPGLTGAWSFDSVPGLAKVASEIARQSAMIGYLNAFMMYTATSAFAVVLVLMVRRRRSS